HQQAHHVFRLGTVGDADVDVVAALAVGAGPVHHFLRHQLGIGNDDFRPLARAHRRRADADALDLSGQRTDLDQVAHADRSFHDEDQPGYEVVDDVLQAEADAHAERSGNESDLRRIDAERGQGEYGADDDNNPAGEGDD